MMPEAERAKGTLSELVNTKQIEINLRLINLYEFDFYLAYGTK